MAMGMDEWAIGNGGGNRYYFFAFIRSNHDGQSNKGLVTSQGGRKLNLRCGVFLP